MIEQITRNPAVEEAPLQSELMLFDPVTSRFFVLNQTMAYVWKRCDSLATVDALVGGLSEEFQGAEPVNIRDDVERALEELVTAGLVIRTGEAPVDSQGEGK